MTKRRIDRTKLVEALVSLSQTLDLDGYCLDQDDVAVVVDALQVTIRLDDQVRVLKEQVRVFEEAQEILKGEGDRKASILHLEVQLYPLRNKVKELELILNGV